MRTAKIKTEFEQEIGKRISELYKTKARFSKKLGIKPRDLSRKVSAAENKLKWLKSFLKFLNFDIKIINNDEHPKNTSGIP